jgi:hypothetical protein
MKMENENSQSQSLKTDWCISLFFMIVIS